MENISKIVISANGNRVGYVLDVAVDFEHLKKVGYIIVDEESENEFLLRLNDIKSISENHILISDETLLEFSVNRETFFGKEIFDENCISFGHAKEMVFKGNVCEKIITEKCEILAKNISKVGKNVIFLQFKRKKGLKSKKTFPKLQSANLVKIQDVRLQKETFVPQKVMLSASFYIGKICGENLFGYNNEIIAARDEKITRAIFEKAKKHNALNKLFFAIKR